MTYEPNIPVSNISPANQQAQIMTNFSQFASIFASSAAGINYNHTALNNGNQGKHEAIILTQQTSDPVVNDDYVALYTKNATSKVSTTLQIFERIQQFVSTIPNDPMQLTYDQVNTAGPLYQSFLVGGYLLYLGAITGMVNNKNDITNTITLSPAPTKILCPIASSNSVTTGATIIPCGISTNILNTTQFTITMSSPWISGAPVSYNLTWMCIALA